MIYLVVGNGKLAKHLIHYFKLINLDCFHWHYQNHPESDTPLSSYIQQLVTKKKNNLASIRIFIALKDAVIEDFINTNLSDLRESEALNKNQIFHCSGSLVLNNAIGLHPLMTFSHELYDLKTYQSIPFVTCSKLDISKLLPDLPNNIYSISKEQQSYYHALCVITGNFAQILWQKTSHDLEQKLNLPKDLFKPYIKKVAENFINQQNNCLTGPLARKDKQTIRKNLDSLNKNNKQLHQLYQEFCSLYHEN